jgi:sulfur-oxidizing protein SoxA
MKKMLLTFVAVATALGATAALATPEEDRKAMIAHFKKRFPDVPLARYGDGVYAIDAASRAEWITIEEFPPYEIGIENGKELFSKPFKNGKTYASCFQNGGIGIRQNFPYFDAKSGKVKTLEQEINECREKNGEEPLDLKRGAMADISAYMAYTSRGKKFNVLVPDDPAAKKAYESGKAYYYAKRGQLNMSCADCHVSNAGNRIRADILSPALGQATHFPVYRSNPEWGELGTLHRRFAGCNEQVRAKAQKPQSDAYRNLEYFMTYMVNGMEVNGPAARK